MHVVTSLSNRALCHLFSSSVRLSSTPSRTTTHLTTRITCNLWTHSVLPRMNITNVNRPVHKSRNYTPYSVSVVKCVYCITCRVGKFLRWDPWTEERFGGINIIKFRVSTEVRSSLFGWIAGRWNIPYRLTIITKHHRRDEKWNERNK